VGGGTPVTQAEIYFCVQPNVWVRTAATSW
jgi:hypothetical protein